MPSAFTHYIKNRNNYCCRYLGHVTEYIMQLNLLRPVIENQFPGMQVYLCCNDKYLSILENEEKVISSSMMSQRKKEFAYIRDILSKDGSNPILDFIKESNLDIPLQIMKKNN